MKKLGEALAKPWARPGDATMLLSYSAREGRLLGDDTREYGLLGDGTLDAGDANRESSSGEPLGAGTRGLLDASDASVSDADEQLDVVVLGSKGIVLDLGLCSGGRG
ncbi:unnamed protein product, partial [Ilex paraguariensis]